MLEPVMTDAPTANPRTYDVFFVTSATRRFYLTNPNHGVTVTSQGLAWTADGTPRNILFSDITEIHLQTAAIGNSGKQLDQCKIVFGNGERLTVADSKANGLPDAAQTPVYRDFVRDLHARLAKQPNGTISYSAGVSKLRYRFMLATLVIAFLFFVATPIGLALFTGDLTALGYGVGGVMLCFPLLRLAMTNTPRSYTPDQLPAELLS
jgi:hypothetical protein